MNKKTKIALLALCSIVPAICLVQAIVYAFSMGVLGLEVNLLGVTVNDEARLVSLGILIMLSLAGMAAVGPPETRQYSRYRWDVGYHYPELAAHLKEREQPQ